jgi:hypothetical protein
LSKNISLCAKWVISPNNKKTIKIARHLFDDITNFQEKELIKDGQLLMRKISIKF